MTITEYLEEIEHAASQVIALVWSERDRLQQIETTIDNLTREMGAAYAQVEYLTLNPDLDDDNLSTTVCSDTYFGPDKDRHHELKNKAELEDLVSARRFSTGVLSGNLLQYAKQGISIVYGGLSSCPDGRPVGSQALKTVIWESRNHALHWEDGKPHRRVKECFETLAREFGPSFSDYRTRNLGFEVVGLLGWRNLEDFKRDLLTL